MWGRAGRQAGYLVCTLQGRTVLPTAARLTGKTQSKGRLELFLEEIDKKNSDGITPHKIVIVTETWINLICYFGICAWLTKMDKKCSKMDVIQCINVAAVV